MFFWTVLLLLPLASWSQGGIQGGSDCLINGGTFVCPTDTTFQSGGETVTLEADIVCPLNSVSQSETLQASYDGLCECVGSVIQRDLDDEGTATGEETPINCDCILCPEGSMSGVAYECDTEIIGTCKSMSCSFDCNKGMYGNKTDTTDPNTTNNSTNTDTNVTIAPTPTPIIDATNNNTTTNVTSPDPPETPVTPVNITVTVITIDLSMASVDDPLIVYSVLTTDDVDSPIELVVPVGSNVYIISSSTSSGDDDDGDEENLDVGVATEAPDAGDVAVRHHKKRRFLQTTTCPPAEGTLVEFMDNDMDNDGGDDNSTATNDNNSSTTDTSPPSFGIVQLDLDGMDAEIVVCSSSDDDGDDGDNTTSTSSSMVLANYFVAYETTTTTTDDDSAGNATTPDYEVTFDFISDGNVVTTNNNVNSTNSSAPNVYSVDYGPGADQDGVGWIILAGNLVWYESSLNITIGDPCPTSSSSSSSNDTTTTEMMAMMTLIPPDPSFPFTLYTHNGVSPEDGGVQVLHGCDDPNADGAGANDGNETAARSLQSSSSAVVVAEVSFVFVEIPNITLAPTPAPVLPPVGFSQSCDDFDIQLGDELKESCESWCSPGTSESFDWGEVNDFKKVVVRNTVCRCCKDLANGECRDAQLQSKWECWTSREVWDLTEPIPETCAERDIESFSECEEFCKNSIDPVAYDYSPGKDDNGLCKCAGVTVCGREIEEEKDIPIGLIIALSVLLILLCCCCYFCFLSLKRRREMQEEVEDDEYEDPEHGDEGEYYDDGEDDDEEDDYDDDEEDDYDDRDYNNDEEKPRMLGYGEQEMEVNEYEDEDTESDEEYSGSEEEESDYSDEESDDDLD